MGSSLDAQDYGSTDLLCQSEQLASPFFSRHFSLRIYQVLSFRHHTRLIFILLGLIKRRPLLDPGGCDRVYLRFGRASEHDRDCTSLT